MARLGRAAQAGWPKIQRGGAARRRAPVTEGDWPVDLLPVSPRGKLESQSTVAPDSFTTFAHFAMSALTNVANASGDNS